MNGREFLGVDGCAHGWVAFSTHGQESWDAEIFETISDLWSSHARARLILIDIPIGLKTEGPNPRNCDKAARAYLTGKRSSSIFPTPCRAVLNATSYDEANRINREKTTKGLSKQSWNITGKIKQLDELLRSNRSAREVFIESHPEVCFTALSGGRPMEYYKKKEGGMKERLELLKRHVTKAEDLVKSTVEKFGATKVAIDDVFDALVLALSASFGREHIRSIPRDFEYDAEDLPMRMALPLIEDS